MGLIRISISGTQQMFTPLNDAWGRGENNHYNVPPLCLPLGSTALPPRLNIFLQHQPLKWNTRVKETKIKYKKTNFPILFCENKIWPWPSFQQWSICILDPSHWPQSCWLEWEDGEWCLVELFFFLWSSAVWFFPKFLLLHTYVCVWWQKYIKVNCH